MKFSRYIIAAMIAPLFAACSSDDLGPTIFPDVSDEPDPSSYTYKFDKWLNKNFRDIYNVDFKYLMEDVEADMNYNLVPATYDNARDLALLTKYLWYDSYKELVGEDFIKSYGPRILHLVGSPAYNPQTGTETLGLAEGGLKVTLFKVNEMDLDDINMLNEYYFRTMHHEFGHILHQTKSYPTDFNLLSTGRYDDSAWQSRQPGYVASLGFVTPYASSQAREDFAETIANYLTRTPDQMDLILWMAQRGWATGSGKADGELEDENANYYCYYFYDDPSDVKTQHYFLYSQEQDYKNYRVGLVGLKGEYLTTVEEVEAYLEKLSETHEIFPVEDKDNVNGYDIILQKQSIARNWFADQWKISFDQLRDIVQKRQNSFDIDALRDEVNAIQ
ncbi:MAG: putative zinc-binding metallopeptidase [Muribaculaceae bacterium]|nr:putative zinc-binding metallopeptidase [Muribaculaceae bacterium]